MSANMTVEKKSKSRNSGTTEVVQEKRGRGRPPVYPKEGMSIHELQQLEGENYEDEFEEKVPSRYQYLRAKLSTTYRELAKNFVPEMYNLLKSAKLKPEECRQKLVNDIGRYWNKNHWMRYLPDEAKDIKKVEAGKKGGEASKMTKEMNNVTMEALKAVGVSHAAVSPEEFEAAAEGVKEKVSVAAHERAAPEPVKTIRASTINFEIDLTTWQTQLLKAVDKAERSGSKKLVGEISAQGKLLWIDAAEPLDKEEKKSK